MSRFPLGGALPALLLILLLSAGCTRPAPQVPPSPVPPPVPAPLPAPLPGPAPDGPKLGLSPVAAGLTRPVYAVHAGDGSGRLFILEQPGRIRILQEGALQEKPLLDISSKVNSASNEQGLLGLAFAPDFAASGLFYVHYTGARGQTVIARYQTGADGLAAAISGSIILTVPQPYPNHNGGSILFGPDGYLYIALGDGGSAGDPQNHAQNVNSLLGKILRIDVSGQRPYAIPPTNPLNGRAGKDEIWAFGLRNPWRISFDRLTGDLYIADVGQRKIEEINFQPAGSPGGQNYGWRIWEGSSRYAQGSAPGAVFPVLEYQHGQGHCSVTGGYVYRGQALPQLVGTYLYGDYCSGQIWGARREGNAWRSEPLLATTMRISSFGEDEAGELYLVDHGGVLYRLEPQS